MRFAWSQYLDFSPLHFVQTKLACIREFKQCILWQNKNLMLVHDNYKQNVEHENNIKYIPTRLLKYKKKRRSGDLNLREFISIRNSTSKRWRAINWAKRTIQDNHTCISYCLLHFRQTTVVNLNILPVYS